ncbi:MAG TPA: class I SAM-dependent methyltransferase, partial [Chthoniobacteraceae bacterium]
MSFPASLEAYELERSDFAKVLAAINEIRGASLEQLGDLKWLLGVVRRVGLVPIPEFAITYEGEEEWVNGSQQGLIQLPREFAQYLILLSEQRVARYLEIGCFNGASACIATAYLERFNPELQAATIDLWPAFIFYDQVAELLPLKYVVGQTSFAFSEGAAFDAVFIDGDHSFDWAWADYLNVGRAARICAMHDIRNAPYLELPLGGVCAAWELIKRREA